LDTETGYTNAQPLHNPLEVREEAKLAEFIGEKKKEYYFKKWQKDNSWNWAAFFLTLGWLGYRKMYRPVVYVLLAFIAIDLLVALLGIEGNSFNNSIGIGLSVGLGIGGNLFYKKHALKQIEDVNRLSISEEEKLREIKKRGGTSKMGVLFSILMFIGYLVVTMVLTSIFS
jgi:hypothetical protein